jgi:2'-hydroxyisoflavone reductase
MPNRREFLAQTAIAGVGGGILVMAGTQRAVATEKDATSASAPKESVLASKPLRILILGGAGFIGPHFLRAAVDRGHQVSAFIYRPNKEKDLAELPADVEPLFGDRNGDRVSIQNRDWDAVFDLATIATYRFPGAHDERSSVVTYTGTDDPYALKSPDFNQYGALKVLCEREAEKQFTDKSLSIRLGHPVGPNERTGALTYWVARMEQGGEMLAAGDPLLPVQLIDLRDLADWTVRIAERGTTGIFNAVGPAQPLWDGLSCWGRCAAPFQYPPNSPGCHCPGY